MSGKLILVPTPLDQSLPLETVALNLLSKDCMNEDVLLLVEEHKVARQRWIQWGLPRDAIQRFILFNEHTQEESKEEIISKLKSGKNAILMSDGGLPAFCDPGQKLVKSCHEKGIAVTSTPFPNSISLAISLSGMDHSKFSFAGFLSTDHTERKKELDQLASRNETVVMMDTPYRLNALVADIGTSRLKNRKFFLATNLNSNEEKIVYGTYSQLQSASEKIHKPEFVLVISGA
jgi:16S rRNA (cytidine1402-2'-O)-methyltransferase